MTGNDFFGLPMTVFLVSGSSLVVTVFRCFKCITYIMYCPMDCKTKPVNLKVINPEYPLEGLMLKLQYFDHLTTKSLIGQDPDAGTDKRQAEKGMTEDEMVGWHHRLNGCQFDRTPGDGEEQGSLECCSPLGHKELDTS